MKWLKCLGALPISTFYFLKDPNCLNKCSFGKIGPFDTVGPKVNILLILEDLCVLRKTFSIFFFNTHIECKIIYVLVSF